MYQCEVCSKSFGSEQSLAQHAAALQHFQFTCDDCDKTFGSERALQLHTDAVHRYCCFSFLPSMLVYEIVEGRITCPSSFFKRDLKAINLTNNTCTSVHNFIFSTLSTLLKLYLRLCQTCGKRFNSTRALGQHIDALHCFKCGKCENEYRTAESLQDHIDYRHTYACDTCGKKFGMERSLEQHRNDAHGYSSE
jgi:hypothetical protein